MPKSKTKRKNGKRGGSVQGKRVAKYYERKQAAKDAVIAKITQQMLGG